MSQKKKYCNKSLSLSVKNKMYLLYSLVPSTSSRAQQNTRVGDVSRSPKEIERPATRIIFLQTKNVQLKALYHNILCSKNDYESPVRTFDTIH